jgi:hypothetical protein
VRDEDSEYYYLVASRLPFHVCRLPIHDYLCA